MLASKVCPSLSGIPDREVQTLYQHAQGEEQEGKDQQKLMPTLRCLDVPSDADARLERQLEETWHLVESVSDDFLNVPRPMRRLSTLKSSC